MTGTRVAPRTAVTRNQMRAVFTALSELTLKALVPMIEGEGNPAMVAKDITDAGLREEKKMIRLNPNADGSAAKRLENRLRDMVVGQDNAVRAMSSAYQIFQAGFSNPNRPLSTMLFLGPTGSGKTRIVEAMAEILFRDGGAMLKVDCAEYQGQQETARLIGAPPGYIGHVETSPLLTQDALDRFHTEEHPFSLVLFDEIEKASDALWQLLLGVLDTGTLTLGNNTKVSFARSMIFLTSNLGAREICELISGPTGFAPASASQLDGSDLDQKIHKTALEAARRRFSPEFMNRIDHVVVFGSLKKRELRRVLDIELQAVQLRIDNAATVPFSFSLTDDAKEFLLLKGVDQRYGARHLKRAIERFVVQPLATLTATDQIEQGDVITVGAEAIADELWFGREDSIDAKAQAALESVRRSRAAA